MEDGYEGGEFFVCYNNLMKICDCYMVCLIGGYFYIIFFVDCKYMSNWYKIGFLIMFDFWFGEMWYFVKWSFVWRVGF